MITLQFCAVFWTWIGVFYLVINVMENQGSLVWFWARVTVCVEFLSMFSVCKGVSTVFSGFLPSTKNLPVSGLDKINCPLLWISVLMCMWMCVLGALWWTGVPPRMYISLRPNVHSIGSGSTAILTSTAAESEWLYWKAHGWLFKITLRLIREYMQFCKLSHMRRDITDNYSGLTKGETKHEILPY